MVDIKPGKILYTKDGRRIGNAVVLEQCGEMPIAGAVWLVETDFGNRCRFVHAELVEMFHVEYSNADAISMFGESTVERWMDDRNQLRMFHASELEPREGVIRENTTRVGALEVRERIYGEKE